jgi:hypothetical protein
MVRAKRVTTPGKRTVPDEQIAIGGCLIGRAAAWVVSFLGAVYAVVTVLGLLSLSSPDAPIGDPFFTLMEGLILIMAPLMVVTMAAVYVHAAPGVRIYALLALVFMSILAGLTSSVHAVVLTAGDQIMAAPGGPSLVSFTWPSVVYALDILAWDWFFALAMLCAVPVFTNSGLAGRLRALLIACGLLSLAGLIGVPLGNMGIRNIGIIGYGLLAPAVFCLLGVVLGRPREPQP